MRSQSPQPPSQPGHCAGDLLGGAGTPFTCTFASWTWAALGSPDRPQLSPAQARLPFPILAAMLSPGSPRPCTGSRRLLPCYPGPSISPTLRPLPVATHVKCVPYAIGEAVPSPVPQDPDHVLCLCPVPLSTSFPVPCVGPLCVPSPCDMSGTLSSVLPGGKTIERDCGRHSGGPRVHENHTSPGGCQPSPGHLPPPRVQSPGPVCLQPPKRDTAVWGGYL